MSHIDTSIRDFRGPGVESKSKHQRSADVGKIQSRGEHGRSLDDVAMKSNRRSWMKTWAFPAYSGLLEIV